MNKTEYLFKFHSLSHLRRTSGTIAVTAVQVPGPVQGLDQALAHAPAAEAETTSSQALPRYSVCVFVCLSAVLVPPHSSVPNQCYKLGMWSLNVMGRQGGSNDRR